MRKFIVDTDIGADCDDMVALAYLLGKSSKKECELLAITLSTGREFAPNCALSLLKERGFTSIPVGQYKGNPLPCDRFDHYAKALSKKNPIKVENATTLMRSVLSSNEKCDIICIGPLCNIASFLKSQADDISSLDGISLAKEKIGTLYLMGGAFDFGSGIPFPEWNIEQDIDSARFVFASFPRPIKAIPFETGAIVKTSIDSTEGIVRSSMEAFFESIQNPSLKSRPSWDPLTAMVSLNEEGFRFSSTGKISISPKGISEFHACEEGNASYLLLSNDFPKIEAKLNAFLSEMHTYKGDTENEKDL